MPRPMKWRNVCSLPKNNQFGPLSKETDEKCLIVMTVEEYESIRLIDLMDFKQEDCAEQMNIARTSVQSIYSSARKKLADALVNGKRLTIEGGRYILCNRGNNFRNKEMCHKCRREENV
ncbi:MAG: DUF134 domain-containing protein [Clostridia bacterium]|nr:DUF134 domain-containing protein [Clostridia bacterium]